MALKMALKAVERKMEVMPRVRKSQANQRRRRRRTRKTRDPKGRKR
jgi:hypothetical protein